MTQRTIKANSQSNVKYRSLSETINVCCQGYHISMYDAQRIFK